MRVNTSKLKHTNDHNTKAHTVTFATENLPSSERLARAIIVFMLFIFLLSAEVTRLTNKLAFLMVEDLL